MLPFTKKKTTALGNSRKAQQILAIQIARAMVKVDTEMKKGFYNQWHTFKKFLPFLSFFYSMEKLLFDLEIWANRAACAFIIANACTHITCKLGQHTLFKCRFMWSEWGGRWNARIVIVPHTNIHLSLSGSFFLSFYSRYII